jgi:hypothetical protein
MNARVVSRARPHSSPFCLGARWGRARWGRGITLALSVGLVAGLAVGCGPKRVAPRANETIRFERGATAEFQERVQSCLRDIALAGSHGRDFLRKLAPVRITVGEEVGLNWAERAPPGRSTRIHWDPHSGGEYADGAVKLPCAILLHELTHAHDNYVSLYSGEFEAMRMENWFIWRWGAITGERYQQRFYNQYREFRMPRQILWPQPPAPPPRGPKRPPPSLSD